jgi:hypothetical protein|tara:strand:+ start:724 stop:1113 length:390 start_codon:yes stop_codon:yes gene_type:complete
MIFLEPVIAALLGAGVTALAVFFKKNIAAQMVLKYGSLVKKAYDIIDPILDKNLTNWNGGQVDQAFELAIKSAADGELTEDEIKKIAVYMADAWLPAAAADKVRIVEAMGTTEEQDIVTKSIIKNVNAT